MRLVHSHTCLLHQLRLICRKTEGSSVCTWRMISWWVTHPLALRLDLDAQFKLARWRKILSLCWMLLSRLLISGLDDHWFSLIATLLALRIDHYTPTSQRVKMSRPSCSCHLLVIVLSFVLLPTSNSAQTQRERKIELVFGKDFDTAAMYCGVNYFNRNLTKITWALADKDHPKIKKPVLGLQKRREVLCTESCRNRRWSWLQ